MSRPVIYLDVDGVLNMLGRSEDAEGNECWGDFVVHPNVKPDDIPNFGQGYDLCMSKSMVAALAALPADVVWLTTWRHDAAKHVAPLVGAPEWPVIDWAYEKGAALAQDQAANPRPFVWVDDWEATEANLIYFMGKQLETSKVPYQLIKPDPRQGLTRANMRAIQGFLDWLESLSHDG